MFISSELPEILGLSDRIYVMQSGRITGELPGPGTTEEQVLEPGHGRAPRHAPSSARAPRPAGASMSETQAARRATERPARLARGSAGQRPRRRCAASSARSASTTCRSSSRWRSSIIVIVITRRQPLFLTWQNLMNSLSPEHRHRGPAGHRRDRGHRRRRPRHLGRLHRLRGVGDRGDRPSSRACHRRFDPACRVDAGWPLIVGIATGVILGIGNGLIVTVLQGQPHHRDPGHPGGLRRPGLPGGARTASPWAS